MVWVLILPCYWCCLYDRRGYCIDVDVVGVVVVVACFIVETVGSVVLLLLVDI